MTPWRLPLRPRESGECTLTLPGHSGTTLARLPLVPDRVGGVHSSHQLVASPRKGYPSDLPSRLDFYQFSGLLGACKGACKSL